MSSDPHLVIYGVYKLPNYLKCKIWNIFIKLNLIMNPKNKKVKYRVVLMEVGSENPGHLNFFSSTFAFSKIAL